MSSKKLAIVIAAIAIVAAFAFVTTKSDSPTVEKTAAVKTYAKVETSAGSEHPAETVTEVAALDEPSAIEDTPELVGINVEAALAPRTLGDPDAPVKIEEYASLTCSHCAAFHQNTLPSLQMKYIDEGKVYFVYNDFPLNAPALEAAMIARCLPESRYFKFVKFLFENQETWAYSRDYRTYLKQNVKLLGMSDDTYEACLYSEPLKKGIADKMTKAGEENEIKSTPSFILNGGADMITGAQPYDVFEQKIEALLKQAEGGE